MFGEGISLFDLTSLVKAIREKDLVLQVKILDGGWETMTSLKVQEMIRAVSSGAITNSNDIRLRLFARSGATVPPPRP